MLTRFKSQWDSLHPANVPVAWPNQPFDPLSTTHFDPASDIGWVRVAVLPGDSFQASISGGTKRWRTPGLFDIQVFIPAGTDEEVAVAIADDVVTSLRGVTISDVVLQAASITVVGIDPTGAWYQINVRTVFRFDTLQT